VPEPTEVLPFPEDPTYSVPSATQTTEKRRANVSKVTRVIVHWPAGTESLVDVRVEFEKTPLVPMYSSQWIAKDDTTIAYTVNKAVKASGDLRVTWRNRDMYNSHKVPVDVEYIERSG